MNFRISSTCWQVSLESRDLVNSTIYGFTSIRPEESGKSSCPFTKWLEPFILFAVGLESFPNVNCLLKAKPKLRSGSENAS
jgi:hypothetical protein